MPKDDQPRRFLPLDIAVLTGSDTRSLAEDKSGDLLVERLTTAGHRLATRALEKDDIYRIRAQISHWIADPAVHAIITTGGTGPAPRDVTPEATERVCTKLLPGFGERMRQVSLAHVPTAILSRQTAGVCGQALVVNLPGRPKSIRECLDAVFPAIPYCVDLIHTGAENPPRLETNPERLVAFRPKNA